MKAFVISMVILAVMVAGGIGCDLYLTSVAENISVYADELEKAAEQEDYDMVAEAYTKLDDYWQKNSLQLSALVDHTYMGEVSKSLCEIEAGIKSGEQVEIMLAGSRVNQIIKNLADNEHFYPGNIL